MQPFHPRIHYTNCNRAPVGVSQALAEVTAQDRQGSHSQEIHKIVRKLVKNEKTANKLMTCCISRLKIFICLMKICSGCIVLQTFYSIKYT